EQMFEGFVVKFGGELVRDLISNSNPPQNADYLFRSPLVLAELKIVERDAFTLEDSEKLNKLFHKWMRQGLIRPMFGTWQIELRKLPTQCQQEWMRIHMMPWKRKLGAANNQIKAMKTVLNVPSACGVLFLIDDAHHSFPPMDVMTFIARTLQSTKPDGS